MRTIRTLKPLDDWLPYGSMSKERANKWRRYLHIFAMLVEQSKIWNMRHAIQYTKCKVRQTPAAHFFKMESIRTQRAVSNT